MRKTGQEMESLSFRNSQLSRRVSVLQEEMDSLSVSYGVCEIMVQFVDSVFDIGF